MELAVFGSCDGGLVVGEGPFEARSSPPGGGVAFYRNDFALSQEAPWQVPARWYRVAADEFVAGLPDGFPRVAWSDPEVEPFAEVFGEVTDAIRSGVIEKSVPVVTASGSVTSGRAAGLLQALAAGEGPLRSYAWVDAHGGMAGLSPELLFRLERGVVRTMALAGTARREEREAFGVDVKEIREHEFVAQTLLARLSPLGPTTRHERRIMDLGQLVHFHSPIDVELRGDESLDRLIALLHPTPALGPLPRTDETMAQLLEWRARLGCPASFGAPFGLWEDGVFEALVAIRMVAWEGEQVRIPSGCGVIEESRLVNEWRELRLKREAVRSLFSGG